MQIQTNKGIYKRCKSPNPDRFGIKKGKRINKTEKEGVRGREERKERKKKREGKETKKEVYFFYVGRISNIKLELII
jgi:hypothetical protein